MNKNITKLIYIGIYFILIPILLYSCNEGVSTNTITPENELNRINNSNIAQYSLAEINADLSTTNPLHDSYFTKDYINNPNYDLNIISGSFEDISEEITVLANRDGDLSVVPSGTVIYNEETAVLNVTIGNLEFKITDYKTLKTNPDNITNFPNELVRPDESLKISFDSNQYILDFVYRNKVVGITSDLTKNYECNDKSYIPIITKEYLLNSLKTNKDYCLVQNFTFNESISPISISDSHLGTFSGNLDGDNKSISNINIDSSLDLNVGLFRTLKGKVYNLRLIDPIVVGYHHVGALTGTNSGMISNVAIIDTNRNGESDAKVKGISVGGIAGYNTTNGKIINSFSEVDIIGVVRSIETIDVNSSNIGGLVGLNSGLIAYSYVKGNLLIDETVDIDNIVGGGITAMDNGGVITNCYSTSDFTLNVNIENITFGGIVGNMQVSESSLYYSYYAGSVDINSINLIPTIGGIAAVINNSKIIKSYYDIQKSQIDVAVLKNHIDSILEPIPVTIENNARGILTGMITQNGRNIFTENGWNSNNLWKLRDNDWPTINTFELEVGNIYLEGLSFKIDGDSVTSIETNDYHIENTYTFDDDDNLNIVINSENRWSDSQTSITIEASNTDILKKRNIILIYKNYNQISLVVKDLLNETTRKTYYYALDESNNEIINCDDKSYIPILKGEFLQNIYTDKNYCLVKDVTIDFNFIPIGHKRLYRSGASYEPDYGRINIFNGKFEGNNFSIKDLKINYLEDNGIVGLFGYLGVESEVKNLNITNIYITEAIAPVGGLAAYNLGDITNVSVNGIIKGHAKNVSTNRNSVGMLVGQNSGNISYSSARGTLATNADHAGGLVGESLGNIGSISKSYSYANVYQYKLLGETHPHYHYYTKSAGGISAINYETIIDCFFSGTIYGLSENSHIGGLVGYNNAGSIINSYSNGQILGTSTRKASFISFHYTYQENNIINNYTNVSDIDPYFNNYNSNSLGITVLDDAGSDIREDGHFPFILHGWDFDSVWEAKGNSNWPTLRGIND